MPFDCLNLNDLNDSAITKRKRVLHNLGRGYKFVVEFARFSVLSKFLKRLKVVFVIDLCRSCRKCILKNNEAIFKLESSMVIMNPSLGA